MSAHFHNGVKARITANDVLEMLNHLESLPAEWQAGAAASSYELRRKRSISHDPKHQGAHRSEERTSGKVCHKLCIKTGPEWKGKDQSDQDSPHTCELGMQRLGSTLSRNKALGIKRDRYSFLLLSPSFPG